jgi:isopenicillin-N N-acyltransferase-like protein
MESQYQPSRREFVMTAGGAIIATSLGPMLLGGCRGEEGRGIERTYSESNLYWLEVSGEARERGRIHGEALRSVIAESVEGFANKLGAVGDPQGLIRAFAASTSFDAEMDRRTPHFMEEIRGVAEGANQSFETMYAYNCFHEMLNVLIKLSRNGQLEAEAVPGQTELSRCSGMAVWGQERLPTLLGQTVDTPYFDGAQTVLHVKRADTDVELLLITAAGNVAGFTGINSYGIGQAGNSIATLANSSVGMPTLFLQRAAIEGKTRQEGVDFIMSARHASGANYFVAGPEGCVGIEGSANKVVQYNPIRGPGMGAQHILHTNHPLANDDLNDLAGSGGVSLEGATSERFDQLNALYRGRTDPITVEVYQETFAKPPICFSRGAGRYVITTAAAIMECDSNNPVLHAAGGPPDVTPFTSLRF